MVERPVKWSPWGSASLGKGTASWQDLKWQRLWHVLGIKRRPVWLECSKWGASIAPHSLYNVHTNHPRVQSTDYTTTKKCQSALCTITRAVSQVRTAFRWETTFLGWTFSLHYNAWMPDTLTYLLVVLIQFKSNDFLNNSVNCILWFSHLHTKQMHYWAANKR